MGERASANLRRQLMPAAFSDFARAERLWNDATLKAVIPDDPTELLAEFGKVGDPDAALLGLVNLAAVADRQLLQQILSDQPAVLNDKPAQAQQQIDRRAQLLAVLGTSLALGDEIIRHPELLAELGKPETELQESAIRDRLLATVTRHLAESSSAATNALRREYRALLLQIAAIDLTNDPLATLQVTSERLADLASAAGDAAYQIAKYEVPEHKKVSFAVIGMGKTGGRELNYVSDVDVLYVAEPKDETTTDQQAIEIGTQLATIIQRVLSGPETEPALWEVDANLRPEGRQGQLVRTLESYLSYYERWAENWEFQALLKSRPIAGDLELGNKWRELVDPLIWQAVTRENFVQDLQAMRQRVVDAIPKSEAERQIKLGRGGLRDVEFTVQLLQLVHGRTLPEAKVRGTFAALQALTDAGFVSRTDAAELANCYAFLRALEHRVQLQRLRRTHLLPKTPSDLHRLGRSLGEKTIGRKTGQSYSDALSDKFQSVRRQVSRLHEAIYFRPLLPAYAKLSDAEVALSPDAVKARLEAIGYRDPDGAIRHIAALTEGTTRRAVLQRNLLPVMLSWLGDTVDPDRGLLAFRRLSDELGGAQWFLKLLRDSGTAAHSLAHLLGNSGYLREAVTRAPQTVQWLAEPEALARAGAESAGHNHSGLRPAHQERLAGAAGAILGRAETTEQAITALRSLRRRELARIAAGEVLGRMDRIAAAGAISDLTDLTLQGTLRVARQEAREKFGVVTDPVDMLIIAMGRLGGRELGYGSDADVMFLYEAKPGIESEQASEFAVFVATKVRELLGSVGPEPALVVDADLRPEGKQGVLARSFDSYKEYYSRWMAPWEIQALLRARPIAGAGVSGDFLTDRATAASDLAARFVQLIDPIRYPANGLDPAQVREIRRLKARMEGERLPRGVDPNRHLKLGPGGLSDVEWTVQLLQLQHAGEHSELRVTSTMAAIRALQQLELLSTADAETLAYAWALASRLRSAVVLSTGKDTGGVGDVLPHNRRDLIGLVGTMAGYEQGAVSPRLPIRTEALADLYGGPASWTNWTTDLWGDDHLGRLTGQQIEEMYLRAARHARRATERLFMGTAG